MSLCVLRVILLVKHAMVSILINALVALQGPIAFLLLMLQTAALAIRGSII